MGVSEGSPESIDVWHNGKTVVTGPVNTGIPSAPTAQGTFAVFEHSPSVTMSGTNPDGSHYSDPGVPYVSYFNGGDALHGFLRGVVRLRAEPRVRRDAVLRGGRGLPVHADRDARQRHVARRVRLPAGMVASAANSVQAMHSPEWTAALEAFDHDLVRRAVAAKTRTAYAIDSEQFAELGEREGARAGVGRRSRPAALPRGPRRSRAGRRRRSLASSQCSAGSCGCSGSWGRGRRTPPSC